MKKALPVILLILVVLFGMYLTYFGINENHDLKQKQDSLTSILRLKDIKIESLAKDTLRLHGYEMAQRDFTRRLLDSIGTISDSERNLRAKLIFVPKPYKAPQIDSLWTERYQLAESLERDQLIESDLERKTILDTLVKVQEEHIQGLTEVVNLQDSTIRLKDEKEKAQDRILEEVKSEIPVIREQGNLKAKAERKKGRKEGAAGVGLIGIIILIIVL